MWQGIWNISVGQNDSLTVAESTMSILIWSTFIIRPVWNSRVGAGRRPTIETAFSFQLINHTKKSFRAVWRSNFDHRVYDCLSKLAKSGIMERPIYFQWNGDHSKWLINGKLFLFESVIELIKTLVCYFSFDSKTYRCTWESCYNLSLLATTHGIWVLENGELKIHEKYLNDWSTLRELLFTYADESYSLQKDTWEWIVRKAENTYVSSF